MSNENSVSGNVFVDDVVRSAISPINSVTNKVEEVAIQSSTGTTKAITTTEVPNCAVEDHGRPLHVVDERVTTLMNSDTTTNTLSPSAAEEFPVLDFTDLLLEADEQLQKLIGAIALQEGEEVVQDPAKTRNNSNRTENDECNDASTSKGTHDADESIFNLGVSSSTSTPLMSNIPCIGSTSDDDHDASTPDFETTLPTLVPSSESKPKDKQDSNSNDLSRRELLQSRQGEEEDECTTVSATPEKSFLWYYPKSLFITSAAAATATTMAKSHELLDSKDCNHKKWWWNTTNSSTNTTNVDDSSTLRAYPQDSSLPVDRTSSSLLLRKQLQTALDQQQQQFLLQQPNNPTTTTPDNPSKLLAVRNHATGCTAIQLGEETFRITISIPDITISQVIHYISNPNTLSSWFHAVITSTTHTANPVSSTRHHLSTSTTGTKTNGQTEPCVLPVTAESTDLTITTTTTRSKEGEEEALSLSSSALEGQQRFDAEWFESTVTLRIPTFWCSCYNLWIQLVKLTPSIINNESSSQLTLFVDHRRSRISITYLLGGCEVNHTFTFTSTATTAPATSSRNIHNQQHQRQLLVHIKDTLRVIPLGSSSTNHCYRCIRPLLRKYVLPNIQSHMKQAMMSLENLQAVFTKGSQQHHSGNITTSASTLSTGDDLTTPLLSSI